MPSAVWPRVTPRSRRGRQPHCCSTFGVRFCHPETLWPHSAPREREVFGLLARGASNADIGARLFLTGNTVKTHVRAVLSGLGLPDRIHVVIWAYENGMVRPGDGNLRGAGGAEDHPRPGESFPPAGVKT